MDSRPCPLGLAALALAAALAMPRRASADAPPSPKPASDQAPPPAAADDDEDAGPDAGARRPAARDTRVGQLLIGGKYGFIAPAGHLAPPRPALDVGGTGMTFGGTLGIGISRNVALQATGGYSLFSAPPGCTVGCKGHSVDLGLGFTYHLVQGLAVDPWASYGVGFRIATYTTNIDLNGADKGIPNTQHYQGFDFARIGLGADFFPSPFIGIGPYFSVDVGASMSPEEAPLTAGQTPVTGVATYAFFQLGVHLVFDPFVPLRSGGPPRARSTQAARGGSDGFDGFDGKRPGI